jgi:predicted membrane chloride channel (bestrophin family)
MAISVRVLISISIILSAGLALVEILDLYDFSAIRKPLDYFELIVLGVFTAEFGLRLISSPSKREFIADKFNWIDFLAIAPFYLGIDNATILRVFRLLRILRVVKSFKVLQIGDLFDFRDSIIRKVSPLVGLLVVLKGIVWVLESKGMWFDAIGFDTLFTIIGFALGVVLSQKIGTTYGKYLEIEDRLFQLQGKITSLCFNIEVMRAGRGKELVRDWITEFLRLYHGDRAGAVRGLRFANEKLHKGVAEIGNTEYIPFHRMAAMMQNLFEEGVYILSKRSAYTPKAYELLLQQTTVLYLILLLVFIPGIRGLISVVFACYLLYGMYYITKDLDIVAGSDTDVGESLVYLKPEKMQNFLDDLNKDLT